MIRKFSPLQILALLALLLFTAFITWRTKKIERALAAHDSSASLRGRAAPNFSLDSLEGSRVSLAEFRGKKKVVVSYWASWCGPCRVELPELKQFYEKYHKKDSDFEVVAISVDDDRASAEAFAARAKLPFPVLLDLEHNAADAYSVDAIPATFIVDKNGIVNYATTGLEEALEVRLALQLGVKIENVSKTPNETTSE